MSSPTLTDQAQAPCLLLVEDSQTTQALLAKHLANYRVTHAADGEEAWQILTERDDIEIVLTDLQMPNLNGHQLLVRIRKSPDARIQSLPVIVMTAAGDKSDRDLAFLNGANDFITKPVDDIELQARVSVHYRLAKTIRELEESRGQLSEQATTDPLTRLKNRRAFLESGDASFSQARRRGGDCSVLAVDIDHFKRINDAHGHHVGDEALIVAARTLLSLTRSEDTVARTGGEEFAVLLPGTNRLGAAVLAERIRVAIERERMIVSDKILTLTVSVGVASLNPDGGHGITDLVQTADRRLYLAKENGRNRICVNDEGKTSFAP